MKTLNEIKISERIAENLATRRAADELFDFVQANSNKAITLDFKSVLFVSRSFAHEYLLKKREIRKKIIEKNMSSRVKKMFKLVDSEKVERKTYSPTLQSFSLTAKNL